jgi:hypothetical protein
MIQKIIILLFFVISCITCGSHNSTVFLNNDYRLIHRKALCDPEKPFPQMIIIPYFRRASQIVPNCKTYPVSEVALAFFVFYHQWLEYFEDDNMAVRGMLEKVMVQWDTKKRAGIKGFDLDGKRIAENRNIIGLVETKNMIWVWQGYDHKISESALIHELVHLALIARLGHGDSDHEGLKYRGWTKRHTNMIIEAKQMLRAFEL